MPGRIPDESLIAAALAKLAEEQDLVEAAERSIPQALAKAADQHDWLSGTLEQLANQATAREKAEGQ